jgi:hypothetical protein
VSKLEVIWFGENGWTPVPKVNLDLPIQTRPQVAKSDLGEIGLLPHVQEAQKKQDEKVLEDVRVEHQAK